MAEEQLQFNITGDATKLISELERAARAVASAKTAFNGIKSTLSEVAQTSSSLSASMEKATGSINKSASATRSNTQALSDLANSVKLLAGSVSSLDEKISKLAAATTRNTTATRQNSAAMRDETNAVNNSSNAVSDLSQRLANLGNSAKAAKSAMSGIGGNVQVGGAGVGAALSTGFNAARASSGLLNNSVKVLSATFSGLRAVGGMVGDALSSAFNRVRTAISNTFNANSGLLSSLRQNINYAVQFYTVGQAINFVRGAVEHVTSGIIGFNSQLQYTRIAFSAVFRADQVLMFDEAMKTTGGNIAESVEMMNSRIADSYGSLSSGLTGTFTTAEEVTSALRAKAKAEAEDYVEILREYANVTPFKLEDITSASRRMAAFGFQADEILPSINAIGQQVAAIGGGGEFIDRVTYALGQMRTAGKVYAQDMLQLSNAGIAGYQILANHAGKTVTEIKNLAKKGMLDGKVASEVILTYLQQRFDGAMTDLANTYRGAKTTISDMTRSLTADAFVPLYSAFEKVAINFASMLTRPEAKQFAEDIRDNVITPITEFIFDIIPAGIEGIAQFGAAIYNSAVTAGTPLNALVNIVAAAVDAIQQGIPIAVDLLGNKAVQAVLGLVLAFKLLHAVIMGNPILALVSIVVASLGIIDKVLRANGTSLLEVFKNVVVSLEPIINNIFGFINAIVPVIVQAVGQVVPVILQIIG